MAVFLLLSVCMYFPVGSWLSSNDIEIKGVSVLESVLLPAIVVSAFSYLFIRHGLSLIKRKKPERNIPPNQNNADEKFM